jgi:hypothetical protein
MRKLILFLICLLFCSSALAVELNVTKEYEQDLIRRVRNIYTSKELIGPPPKCGTSIMLELFMVKDKLSPETIELLRAYLTRPSLQKSYNTPGGHFKIHYDTTGTNAVYHSLEDNNPVNGIPDYVDRCAEIFDYVWLKEVDTMGYRQPSSDGSMGGDSRCDIYIVGLGTGYCGITYAESSTTPWWSYTGYTEIANNFVWSGYPDQYDLMRVTAAHEFFHSIQFGYDLYEGCDPYPNWRPYWMEMSSTWMEDQTFDNVNDYIGYLPYFFNYPWWSLKTFSDDFNQDEAYHCYGACVFSTYLSEKFGVNIMRQIWEECGRVPESNVWSAIASLTGNLEETFREFTVWNFFTGNRADTANYYSEGNLWYYKWTTQIGGVWHYEGDPIQIDSIPTLYHYSYPVEVDSIPKNYQPQGLAADYIFFCTDTGLTGTPPAGGLRIEFYGHSNDSWKGSVIGYSDTLVLIDTMLMSPEKQDGIVEVINWNRFDNAIFIPARINGDTLSSDFKYNAFYDTSLTSEPISPDIIKVLQSSPNPFMIEGEECFVNFPMIINEATYVEINIFTVAGELVRRVFRGNLPAGDYSRGDYIRRDAYPGLIPALAWDGKNEKGQMVASGIYLYQVKTKKTEVLKKMAVIRK